MCFYKINILLKSKFSQLCLAKAHLLVNVWKLAPFICLAHIGLYSEEHVLHSTSDGIPLPKIASIAITFKKEKLFKNKLFYRILQSTNKQIKVTWLTNKQSVEEFHFCF